MPRQPRLVPAATAELELFSPYARAEAVRGLSGFSHVWVIFLFHRSLGEGWRPTVRPPLLGGRKRVGVFASRSPFRPNAIGISAVELTGIRVREGLVSLLLRGVDLVDGTPVLDIKPYVPYTDAIPNAKGGFARDQPPTDLRVEFSPTALAQIEGADPQGVLRLKALIEQVLRQDPRPGYLDRYPERTAFGMRLYDLNIHWHLDGQTARVQSVQKG